MLHISSYTKIYIYIHVHYTTFPTCVDRMEKAGYLKNFMSRMLGQNKHTSQLNLE